MNKEINNKIWRNYFNIKTQTRVIRSGYAMFGVYEMPKKRLVDKRSESVLEHAGGIIALMTMLNMFYPEMFEFSEADFRFMLLHDLPEIYMGDIPDDGRQEKDTKRSLEEEYFSLMMKQFPEKESRENLIRLNKYQLGADEKSRKLFLIDKLEAVLQAMVYQTIAKKFDRVYSREISTLSERDRKFAEEIGSTEMVDLFLVNFLDKTQGFIEEERDIAIGIIVAGFLNLGWRWPSWTIKFGAKVQF